MVSGQLAEVHTRRGDVDMALSHRTVESEIRQQLIDDYPDRVAYQTSQCQTLEKLGEQLGRDGKKEKAMESFDRAIALARSVTSAGAMGPQGMNLVRRLEDKRARAEKGRIPPVFPK